MSDKRNVRVAVVYHSNGGRNLAMAQAVAEGVQTSGAEAKLFDCTKEVDIAYLAQSDAIVFGSPTYMGSISAQMKNFFDGTSAEVFRKRQWVNKVAAGFTNSSAPSGDKLNTLMQMMIFAMQQGMVWVGMDLTTGFKTNPEQEVGLNRLGSWMGAVSQSYVDESATQSDLQTAQYLGARVTTIAAKLRS
jgi:NAD(P)H dehydrogenase (quinone)